MRFNVLLKYVRLVERVHVLLRFIISLSFRILSFYVCEGEGNISGAGGGERRGEWGAVQVIQLRQLPDLRWDDPGQIVLV